MFNLFDIMRQAQGGGAMDNLARQFGLAPEQARRAVEALLPAFSLGMQRQAADPNGLAQLLGTFGTGRYAGFYESPTQAFSPQSHKDGADALERIFGSPEVSRQVARQAAALSGIGTDILRQMMPVVAGMLMGALFRAGANQRLGGVFGHFADMPRGGEAAPPRGASAPNASGPSGPGAAGSPSWDEIVADMVRGGVPGGAPAPTPNPPDAGSTGYKPGAFEEMIGGMLGGARSTAQPQGPGARPEPQAQAGRSAPETPLDPWSQMFQTGREVQDQHMTALQNIFDTFWGAPRKPS